MRLQRENSDNSFLRDCFADVIVQKSSKTKKKMEAEELAFDEIAALQSFPTFLGDEIHREDS